MTCRVYAIRGFISSMSHPRNLDLKIPRGSSALIRRMLAPAMRRGRGGSCDRVVRRARLEHREPRRTACAPFQSGGPSPPVPLPLAAADWPPTARAAPSSPRPFTAPSLSLCPPCFRLLPARSPSRRAGRRRTPRRARSHRAAQPRPPQLVCPQGARVARVRSPRGDGRAPAPASSRPGLRRRRPRGPPPDARFAPPIGASLPAAPASPRDPGMGRSGPPGRRDGWLQATMQAACQGHGGAPRPVGLACAAPTSSGSCAKALSRLAAWPRGRPRGRRRGSPPPSGRDRSGR